MGQFPSLLVPFVINDRAKCRFAIHVQLETHSRAAQLTGSPEAFPSQCCPGPGWPCRLGTPPTVGALGVWLSTEREHSRASSVLVWESPWRTPE